MRKPVLCHMQTRKAQISLRSLISAFVVRCLDSMVGYPHFGAIQISVQQFNLAVSHSVGDFVQFFKTADDHLIVREKGTETIVLIYYFK